MTDGDGVSSGVGNRCIDDVALEALAAAAIALAATAVAVRAVAVMAAAAGSEMARRWLGACGWMGGMWSSVCGGLCG